MQMSPTVVISSNGYTAVYDVEAFIPTEVISNDLNHSFHITLITKEEASLLKSQVKALPFTSTTSVKDIVSLGLGGNENTTLFVGILFNSANLLRQKSGLPLKDFHITLSTSRGNSPESFSHSHDQLHHQNLSKPIKSTTSIEYFDALAFYYSTFHLNYHQSLAVSFNAMTLYPQDLRAFIRFGDAGYKLGFYKRAMLSYARAFDLSSSINSNIKKYSIKQIGKCSEFTAWGETFLESDFEESEGVILVEEEEKEMLLVPWSQELKDEIIKLVEDLPRSNLVLEPRDKVGVMIDSKKCSLPRYFRWIIPFKLAVSSEPVNAEHIRILSSPPLSIRHILTLTEERILPSSWFDNLSISNTHLPILDGEFPSMEFIEIFLRLVLDESTTPLLVHCAGGKGRAGSFIAAYLLAYGFNNINESTTWSYSAMSSSEVIDYIRLIRPGSIETTKQEEGIKKWSQHISKRGSPLPLLPPEPTDLLPTYDTIITPINKLINKIDFILLVGLPGSGKTYFRNLLLKRDSSWESISGDEDGGNSIVLSTISTNRYNKLIIDKCNPTKEERKYILSLAQHSKCFIAIYFDVSKELCLARANSRINHPTLPPGPRTKAAIKHFDSILSKPTREEGFEAIITVTSFPSSIYLAQLLSPIPFFKFPRTPHLINLGAATEDDEIISTTTFRTIVQLSTSSISTNQMYSITEKVDGANIGISLNSNGTILIQNRSHYINSSSQLQFKKLDKWIEDFKPDLNLILRREENFLERFILFGEWMVAVHSVKYTSLPNYFLAFDLYDRTTSTFLTRKQLSSILNPTSIPLTPLIYSGKNLIKEEEMLKMVEGESKFSSVGTNSRMEGIYIKIEDEIKVLNRCKIVRGDFIIRNDHWSKNGIEFNELKRN